MAYQKKYYFSFKDLNESLHLVELWHNTESVISAEEIKGHMNPFAVEMPELDHKFQVVRGTGCQINLLSETDMKFFTGLYHVNPTDFMVKHYIGGVINWLGYLNAEMMTEPYDIDFNYQVSITGNDGFSLMDRFSFVQSDGTNYTGLKTKFDILQIIFAKIGLLFTEYRIALSTTFAGQGSGIDKTILHESYIDCANFYDEDDKPMSLRAVIDSILSPYAATIRAESGMIYITDIHTLASVSSINYRQFAMSTGAYSGYIEIDNMKSIGVIGYKGTGTSIERSGGVNRQVVAYSPYPVKNILDLSINNLGEFGTQGAYESYLGYYRKTLSDNKFWTGSNFEASKENLNTEVFQYMKVIKGNGLSVVSELISKPYIVFPAVTFDDLGYVSSGLKMLITGEMLLRTKNNPYNESQDDGTLVSFDQIWLEIKCGDKYYVGGTGGSPSGVWQTDQGIFAAVVGKSNNAEINNQWIGFGNGGPIGIPIFFETSVHGEFNIRVMNYALFGDLWLRNIEVSLTDWDGNELQDNDIEYIGLLDRTFQNEGEKITLTCGTDSLYADRAKILKYSAPDYNSILQWTRNGQTFKIEELLLGSVSSNYKAGFITLMNMKLTNSFLLQNILTDTFIGSAKMMVKSATIDYRNNSIDCTLVEILADDLIIVKDSTVK